MQQKWVCMLNNYVTSLQWNLCKIHPDRHYYNCITTCKSMFWKKKCQNLTPFNSTNSQQWLDHNLFWISKHKIVNRKHKNVTSMSTAGSSIHYGLFRLPVCEDIFDWQGKKRSQTLITSLPPPSRCFRDEKFLSILIDLGFKHCWTLMFCWPETFLVSKANIWQYMMQFQTW